MKKRKEYQKKIAEHIAIYYEQGITDITLMKQLLNKSFGPIQNLPLHEQYCFRVECKNQLEVFWRKSFMSVSVLNAPQIAYKVQYYQNHKQQIVLKNITFVPLLASSKKTVQVILQKDENNEWQTSTKYKNTKLVSYHESFAAAKKSILETLDDSHTTLRNIRHIQRKISQGIFIF